MHGENRRATAELLLQREFPVVTDAIYLNHAAVAPWPRRTAEAVRAFATENNLRGARYYPRWLEAEAQLREQVALFVCAPSADDIAFTKNTSEALSMVAHGFPWLSGDNVVIPDEEFPSNRIVWQSLSRYGVSVREVQLRGHPKPEAALLAATDDRTRLMSVSSVQFGSGLRLDLAALGVELASRGIAFCVDAIQGLGVFPHDVQRMHIDFLMADAHKWLCGPEGIAVFYCAAPWRERLALFEYGWHMTDAPQDYAPRAWRPADSGRRFECGSANMLGIHALTASLSLLTELGGQEIEQRILARTEHLFDLVGRSPQLELLTDRGLGRYAGIVTFRHQATSADTLWRHLQAHGVVCAERFGGIRFSPHCYTPMEQLDSAIELCVAER